MNRSPELFAFCTVVIGSLVLPQLSAAAEPDPRRGLELILTKPYVEPLFDQETFDEVWRIWPEPLRSRAAKANPEERRKMAFDRYGLTTRPDDDSGKPLQFVVDKQGMWSANCFTCHGGKVAGETVLGLPNSHFAAQTLTEDIFATAKRLNKPLPKPNYAGDPIPVHGSNGVTNAVTTTFLLLSQRDADLNRLQETRRPKDLTHYDTDPPPWWRVKQRQRLYADGFAKKDHRALMVLLLDTPHGAKHFRDAEYDFREILAWMQTLEAPKYPFPVDDELAERGRKVFNKNCADCHGTYGDDASFPELIVPIDEVETDPARLFGAHKNHLMDYENSWFTYKGKHKVDKERKGYLAPPLDGVWASAPYLHNGSVPTLWQVLNPDDRPIVWKRSLDGYDREKVGLEVQELQAIPEDLHAGSERRKFFDTRQFGKSAAGHTFPDALTDKEKREVLEYLKTL